ncbi:hypothetical protein lerEdw1_013157 [Lerista edwardsae]|nr:hypothetical protein lerEdw1_013157 [Lerista edwardsae]
MAAAEEEEVSVEVKLEEDEEEEEEEEAGYVQSGRRYKCLTCSKTFPSVPRVLRHLKSHAAGTGDGLASKLSCPSCRKEFPDRAQLRKHQLSHQTERPFHESHDDKPAPLGNQEPPPGDQLAIVVATVISACGECGDTFPSTQELRRHERLLHPGLRPFPCSECGKGFSDRAGLRKHERIHSGIRPHACPHCSKAFLGASDLRKHLKTHLALENRAPEDTIVTATITTYEPLVPAHIHPPRAGRRGRDRQSASLRLSARSAPRTLLSSTPQERDRLTH